MISKDTRSTSESSISDSNEDGRDHSANKVSYFIGMHKLF